MQPFMTTSSASYYLNGNTRLDQHQEICQSTSSSQLHRQLKGEEYSIKNRLRSFEDDRRFVEEISHAYPSLSIHANLSCGIWYLNASVTQRASDPCYFKSTDGHPHHWKFSDTRLNVHIIRALVAQTQKSIPVSDSDSSAATSPSFPKQSSGALIIDSTRKGKRFPDSFSRTIPIWCTVWNRAIHQWRRLNRIEIKLATPTAGTDNSISTTSTTAEPSPSDVVPPLVPSSTIADWDLDLHMPAWISQMEQRQIEEKLPAFVTTLLNSKVDFEPIARGLLKPLRCLWMDRSSLGWEYGDRDFHLLPFTPLLLLQCSRCESETRGIGQRQGWSYIQGAGDDEENWLNHAGINGFTPTLLNQYSTELMQFDYEEDLIERIKEILKEEATKKQPSASSLNRPPALNFHPIPPLNTLAIIASIPPSYQDGVSHFSSSTPPSHPPALLYLYFDQTLEVKQKRKEKLAADQERKYRRELGEDDQESDNDQAITSTITTADSTTAVSSPDLLDWPEDHRVAIPISSQSKSRRALFDILAPSLKFMQTQIDHGLSILLVCEDVSFISCLCVAALLSRPTPASSEQPTTTIEYKPSHPPELTASPTTSPTPTIDKTAIRSSLTLIESFLPSHFPTRLMLKQLNQFFLSHHH